MKTELHVHQLKALATVLEKEQGLIEKPDLPTLWKPFNGLTGNVGGERSN